MKKQVIENYRLELMKHLRNHNHEPVDVWNEATSWYADINGSTYLLGITYHQAFYNIEAGEFQKSKTH